MDLEIILAQSNFFRNLAPESRRALAAIAIPRTVRKRDVLFREGDEGHSMYALIRGRVQLLKRGPGDGGTVIRTVAPGESFAEVAVFERQRYPVTAVALAESFVFLLPRRDLRALLSREDFRDDFIATLLRRQRYLTERIAERSAADVERRFLRFLRDQFGDAPRVRVEFSKKDAAAAIGTAPETLSRLLRRLEREGRLSWRGRELRRTAAGPAVSAASSGGRPTRGSRAPSPPSGAYRPARPRSGRTAPAASR